MNNYDEYRLMKDRLNKLECNGKNEKSPGVRKKLTRQVRKYEKEHFKVGN